MTRAYAIIQGMNKEIEARFLDIDKQKLVARLVSIGAVDKGDILLTEAIFYDKEGMWHSQNRFVRLRAAGGSTTVTYKQNKEQTIDSAREIEFTVSDAEAVQQFLEVMGLMMSRTQEKRRHTFIKDGVTIDIDTWPKIPTYVELEGASEEAIRAVADLLDLDWNDAVFDDARAVLEQRYEIPVGKLRWFTFDRIE